MGLKCSMGVLGLEAGFAIACIVEMTCFFLILRLNDWQAVANKAAERMQSETKAIDELLKETAEKEGRRGNGLKKGRSS